VSLDRAIEAAAEALKIADMIPHWRRAQIARIAVEAAAPHLSSFRLSAEAQDTMNALFLRAERAEAEANHLRELWDKHGKADLLERAERAEATVDALDKDVASYISDLVEERALANRLAKAIESCDDEQIYDAHVAYEEARRLITMVTSTDPDAPYGDAK
jgi:hypothetical protein